MLSRAKLATFVVASAISLSSGSTGYAVTLTSGNSARIDFSSTKGTPPFDFVDFALNFSSANPFGTNESLKFSTFDANNKLLTSANVSSGSSIYTSGLFAVLTENAIVPFNPSTELTTAAFYAIVTPVVGSFDLIGAQADFEHIIFTSGTNQLGVQGTISQTPLPAALPLFAGGLGVMGWLSRRRKGKASTAPAAA